jgi:hypothetical protein
MTPAMNAREQAGLSLAEAAKRVQVCVSYLRAIERRGGASFRLAMRLSRLYGCSANIFLYGQRDARKVRFEKARGKGTTREVQVAGNEPRA